MALRNPKERGARRPAYRRVGKEFEAFDGMNLESDPGALAPNEFRHLENVDFLGMLRPRGGVTTLNTDTLEGCWQFLSDYQPTPNRLYLSFHGCPDVDTAGRSLVWFDIDFSGDLQVALYFPWCTSSAVIGVFGGDIYYGTDDFLKKLHLVQPIFGESPLASAGVSQDTIVGSFPGYSIVALQEFNGLFYVAIQNIASPTDYQLWSWDGLTMTLVENSVAGGIITTMTAFRDSLIIGFTSASNKIRTLSRAGAFANVSPGAGTLASLDMVSHQDNLYIASGSTVLWKFDGSSITAFRTIASAAINSVESASGFLWYVYTSGTAHGILGRWCEAAVFQDSLKDFTTQAALANGASFVRFYRGNLYVATPRSDGPNYYIFHSDVDSISDATWARLALPGGYIPSQMVVI